MQHPTLTKVPALAAVRLSPIGLDDLSSVRYVHATAFSARIAPALLDTESKAWLAQFYAPAYTERLIRTGLMGAWIGRDLIGTAGWSPHPTAAATARLGDLFVLPLFTGCGIGRRLLDTMEASAAASGYRLARADVPPCTAGFFEALGYRMISRGVRDVPPATLPVVFLAKDIGSDPSES